VNRTFTRVSSIPKPKEKKEKVGKKPKNFKIENITIDGNSGEDVNWEDFVKINNNEDDDSTENTNQEQQQKQEQEESSQSN
jgi:hypothetical protein